MWLTVLVVAPSVLLLQVTITPMGIQRDRGRGSRRAPLFIATLRAAPSAAGHMAVDDFLQDMMKIPAAIGVTFSLIGGAGMSAMANVLNARLPSGRRPCGPHLRSGSICRARASASGRMSSPSECRRSSRGAPATTKDARMRGRPEFEGVAPRLGRIA